MLEMLCVGIGGSPRVHYTPSSLELNVLKELNVARRRPKVYIKELKKIRSQYHGNELVLEDGTTVVTKESVIPVDEALRELQDLSSTRNSLRLRKLKLDKVMCLAARDHVEDIGPLGLVGHEGSHKSQKDPLQRLSRYGKVRKRCGENVCFGPNTARNIVMDLIVDDGVVDRSHRRLIFDRQYKAVGVSFGPHARYEHMCVIEFAEDFQSDKKKNR